MLHGFMGAEFYKSSSDIFLVKWNNLRGVLGTIYNKKVGSGQDFLAANYIAGFGDNLCSALRNCKKEGIAFV